MQKLPNMARPCRDCPFRKDTQKGWLGAPRTQEILAADSFVCHKKTDHQCAGHMLILGSKNGFVRLAEHLSIPLNLAGAELVFESETACIEHHKH
jgi:hypothetical protein